MKIIVATHNDDIHPYVYVIPTRNVPIHVQENDYAVVEDRGDINVVKVRMVGEVSDENARYITGNGLTPYKHVLTVMSNGFIDATKEIIREIKKENK